MLNRLTHLHLFDTLYINYIDFVTKDFNFDERLQVYILEKYAEFAEVLPLKTQREKCILGELTK